MAGRGSEVTVRTKQTGDTVSTREKILDCAAQLYSHHGYGEGSIRNIAAEIGIRGPSLYHHFASKEEVTAELCRIAARTARAEFEQVTALGPQATPEELLDAAIAAHLRAMFHPKRYLAALVRIYTEVPDDLREIIVAALAPYLHAWMALLRRVYTTKAHAPEVTEIHVFLIFGAMDSVIEWHYGHRAEHFSLDDVRLILRNLLLHGMGH